MGKKIGWGNIVEADLEQYDFHGEDRFYRRGRVNLIWNRNKTVTFLNGDLNGKLITTRQQLKKFVHVCFEIDQ